MVSINLRDALLNGLKTLPGVREFHLHALVSSPRKHLAVFPFSRPRCRTYLQDILVLLSEQTTPDSPRILVTAIEASLYNIPSTSCAILYISKVDSTGQCSSPSPTAALVRSFILYHADLTTRPVSAEHLWVQLFARAQSQYLFPNSADYSGKRPLTDVKLCGWWKRVFTDVAAELSNKTFVKLFYILPGYSDFEAEQLTHNSALSVSVTHNHQWAYGHPYSQTDIPLPCFRDPSDLSATRNLGNFIPSFDDDPKSRFMDELAYTTEAEGIKSPSRKRPRTSSASATHDEGSKSVPSPVPLEGAEEKSDSRNGKDDRPFGELGKVSPDEFWERMSFRQECVAGAVTGFFTLGIGSSLQSDAESSKNAAPSSGVSPLAPQAGQVSSTMNKRIITLLMTGVEFSTRERAIRATETLENTVRGLCEGISAIPAPVIHAPRPRVPTGTNGGRQTPEQYSSSSFLAPPRTPSPRPRTGKGNVLDVSPNPFPEPEASLETYNSYIYGSICVSNAGSENNSSLKENKAEATSGPPVTVLPVRRKKKRTE